MKTQISPFYLRQTRGKPLIKWKICIILYLLVVQMYRCTVYPPEEGRGDGKQRECLCTLSWSVHHNLTRDGYIEPTCFYVQARFFGKNALFLVMVYSVLFNNVLFKSFILFLNKYVAQIRMPGDGNLLLSIPQRLYTEFWHDLALVINISKCNKQRQLWLTESCSWAFLLKPWVWQGFLSFRHAAKHTHPHLFSS